MRMAWRWDGRSTGWCGGEGGGALRVRESAEEAYGEEPSPLCDLASLPEVGRFRALESVDADAQPDLLEELGGAIVTLAAHSHATRYRILEYVAEFDRLGGWEAGGYRNCAEWLHCRAGINRKAAQEWVRTAHALRRLPLVSASMSRGEISFSKARTLTRAVELLSDPESEHAEAAVLDFAKACTAAELEVRVRSWKLHAGAADEAELERRRHASRNLSVWPDGEGMYRVRGKVTAEVGALLMRAIEAGSDALFREGEDWAPEGGARGPTTREVTPRQRRADALGLLAELAMAVGFGAEEEDEEVEDQEAELVEDAEAGESQGRADVVSAETEGAAPEDEGDRTDSGSAEPRRAGPSAASDADAAAAVSSSCARRSRGGLSERDSRSGDVPLGSAETEGAADGAAPAEPADGAAPANPRTRKSAKRSRSSPRKRRTPCSCGGPPLSGTRAQRYQVTLHVDLQTLAAIGGEGSDESDTARHAEAGGAVQAADRGEVGARRAARGPDRGNGFCHLEDGTRVSAETARRLCCDGSLVRVIRGKEGEILDLGRRTRTISPALRRALEIRDGGCRFPGCGLRFFDGHHVKHWLLGGRTELANLVSLCRFHHRAVHEDGFSVRRTSDGRFQFFDRKGWPIPDRRPPPRLAAGAVERLVADNLRRGITPRWDTPSATYERARQIPWELEERALEALDPVEPPGQEEDVESEGECGPRG